MRAANHRLIACCLAAVLASCCVLAASADPPATAIVLVSRGDAAESVERRPAGVCQAIPVRFRAPLYLQDYCSHSGDSTYRVSFRDANCTIPSDATRTSTATAANRGEHLTCENPKASPVQPLGEWPPVGWFTTTYNLDTRTGNWTCEPADGTTVVYTQTDAVPHGECLPRSSSRGWGSSLTPNLFESQLCAKDCLTHGKVLFSDSECTSPVHALMALIGCFKGIVKTCPTNSTAVPLPMITRMITRTNYYGDECEPLADLYSPGSTVDHFVDGLCLDGQRVQCVTDATTGVKSVVVTTYERDATPGACNTIEETNTYSVKTCVQTDWARIGRINSAKFSCPASP